MAIQWRAYVNNLTTPPSYYPRAIPISVLDLDDIVSNINAEEPDIHEDDIRIVLELWADIVKEELLAGNILELDNFITFRMKIRQTLYAPLEEIRKSSLDVETVISGDLFGDIKDATSFERIDDVEKAPIIEWTQDSITGLIDYVHNLNGLVVKGKNLRLADTGTCGAYIRDSEGVEYKQERLSLNNHSKLIFTPVFPVGDGPAGAASVERELVIRTQYTTDGTLRESVYQLPIRTLNPISISNIKSFISGTQTGGVVSILNQTIGENESARIFSWIDEFNDLFMWAEHDGVTGEPVYVESSGNQVLEVTAGKTITINVDDYDTLIENTVLYGDVMREVVNLDLGSGYIVPFPDTGQTTQYRTGDDADYGYDVTDYDDTDGHAGLSYTKLDASGIELPPTAGSWEYVRDNRTNLIYKLNAGSGNWAKAQSDAAAFSGLGMTWRVPNIKELVFLLSFNKDNDMCDDMLGYVNNNGYWWSSTENAHTPSWAWIVDVDWGETYSEVSKNDTDVDIIFCTGTELTTDFIDNGNGTITDVNSYLMWTKSAFGTIFFPEDKNWNEAIDACLALETGGFTDWRLPNVKELLSILDVYSPYQPFTNGPFNIPVTDNFLWTATTDSTGSSYAWAFDLYAGETWARPKSIRSEYNALAVRDI